MASQMKIQIGEKNEKVKSRVRGPNFQRTEVLKLEELVSDNFEIINSRLTNSVTNKMKTETWECIATQVSSLGFAKRTKEECQNKWFNMKRAAKEAVTKEKLETGGGVSSIVVSDSQQRVAEFYRDSAAFSGVEGGVDSDEIDGLHFISKDTVVKGDCTQEKKMEEGGCSGEQIPVMEMRSCTGHERNIVDIKQKHRGIKRSRQDMLMDYQIQYFKGEVEKQALEKELLEVKLRLLKSTEEKINSMRISEIFQLMNEQ